jgi:hypothetical protein
MRETVLSRRALPQKILVKRTEKSVKGYKINKERTTVALYTNAPGAYKLMLLNIYKLKNSRTLKYHRKRLLLTLKSQCNAWMIQSLFTD